MRTLLATIILLGLAATTAQAQDKENTYTLATVCDCSYTVGDEALIQNTPAYGLVKTSKACFDEYSQLSQDCTDAKNVAATVCAESSSPACSKASNSVTIACYEANALNSASSCAESKNAAEANARLNCKETSNDPDAVSLNCSAIASQSK